MANRPAIDVPVAELIRRGYDRAKGLGHDGLDEVRNAHRELLARLRGEALGQLPLPTTFDGRPRVVFHPNSMADLYSPGGGGAGLGVLMAVLADHCDLCVTHGWLKETVVAFQGNGHDVRTVPLWIASMTVLPRWGTNTDLPLGA